MLSRAKQQLKGSVVMGLESLSNRMQRLGRVELTYGEHVPVEVAVAELDAVTAEEVQAVAAEVFAPSRLSSVALVPG